MPTLKKILSLSVLAVAVLVAACKSPDKILQFPQITFSSDNPIKIIANKVEVIQEYRPPLAKPNIEYLLPVSPATLAQNWASTRLVAVGNKDSVGVSRTAKFVVKRASAIETLLPKTEGIKSLFTVDQDKRYDIELTVEFTLYDVNDVPLASATNNFKRSFTTAENITEAQRHTIWFDKLRELATEMNPALEANIRGKFAPYLTY
ncbi:MAG: hypothetical protein ORN98_09960 [Alphaproteobacteria bacterium]|nr:hypothetical protein [Alphaproteobacteria bacterium]